MPAPLNTVHPTLNMGVTSWTGDVGTWDENGGGTVSYSWELRLVEDDSVVESGGGPSPSGTGTYSNTNGYYLSVDATNTAGTTEARSKVGTLGSNLSLWISPSVSGDMSDITGNNVVTEYGGIATVSDTAEGGTLAIQFDGTDDRLSVPQLIQSGDTEFSISWWVNRDAYVHNQSFFQQGSNPRTVRISDRNYDANKKMAFAAWGGNSGDVTDNTNFGTVGTWECFTFVSTAGSDAKFYINGVELVSFTSGSTVYNSIFAIGSAAPNGGDLFNGKMDDIRVYDRILSQAEISELYNEGRGYDHRPKGLGDETLWYCPSIEDSPNDLSGNGYDATYLGSTGTVSDTGEGGLLAYDCTSNGNTETRGLQGPSQSVDVGNSFSFSWWYKLTDTYESSTNHYAFDCRAGSGSTLSGFTVFYRGTNLSTQIQRGAVWFSGNGGLSTGLSSSDLTDWHHFCVTFDHTTNAVETWVDGSNTDTDTATFTLPAEQPASPATTVGYLGNTYSPQGQYTVSGNMDDSRAFARVLTQDEITHLASGRGVLGQPVQGLGDEVAWYCPTLSGNAGDLSGNRIGMTLNTGTAISADAGAGGTADFSGGTITIDSDTLLDNLGPTTFSGWFNPSYQTASDIVLFDTGILSFIIEESTSNYRLWMNVDGSGGDCNAYTSYDTSGNVYSGEWMHLAMTWDGTFTNGAVQLYRNGVNVTATSTGSGVAKSDTGTTLAGSTLHNGYDDLRIFDRVLTQDEIAHLASDRGVQGTPIVGLGDEQMWFCPTLNQSGIDITGSATNETLVGSMAIVSDTQSGGTHAYDTPDGSTGGMSFTPPASTIASGQAASITVSMWADHTSFSTNYLFSLCENSFSNHLLVQGRDNDFINGLVDGGISGDNVQFTRSSPMQHYVLEFTATTIKVWLSGNLVSTVTGTWSGDTWDRGGIGMLNRSSPTYGSQCTLDDIRVYGRTLTQSEITHLASGRGVLGQPVEGLGDEVAWYCPTLSGNASDLSGNGNTGEYQGGMGVTHYTDGTAAFEFDGADDYVEIANNSSLYEYPITISFWNKRSGYPTNDGGEGYYSAADQGLDGLQIYANQKVNSGQKYEYANSGSNYAAFNKDTDAGVKDQWEHFTLTVDDSGTAWYENGVRGGGTSSWVGTVTQPSVAASVKIGANYNATDFLTGFMDDIRVFSRVLTQAEIAHLASQRGIQGSLPIGLGDEFAWYCPTLQDSPNDLSGNGNAGTYEGGMGTVADTGAGGSRAYRVTSSTEMMSADSLNAQFFDPWGSSFSWWMKRDANNDRPYVCGVKGGSNQGWFLQHQASVQNQNEQFTYRINSQNYQWAGVAPDDLAWHHYAVNISNTGDFEFYKDGVLEYSVASTSAVSGSSTTFDWFATNGAGSGDQAEFDDVRIYDRTLTQAEITYLAASRGIEGSPTSPPPASGWHSPFRNSFFYNPFFDNEAL